MLTLKTHRLSHRFVGPWVLKDVSLTLKAGEMIMLTGANGTGKTTLLRLVATLLAPTAGQVSWLNAADEQPLRVTEARKKMAMVGHPSFLYKALSAHQNLVLALSLTGRGGVDDARHWLERVGLSHAMHKPVESLSAGMCKRVQLAQALAQRPQALLLDEPTQSLDTHGMQQVAEILQERLAQGTSVLVATHERDSFAAIKTKSLHLPPHRL